MSCAIPEFDRAFGHEFVFTSQHYDRNMAGVFLEELGIREPDSFLGVRDSAPEALEAAVLACLKKSGNTHVAVFGDTNTCSAAARAAARAGKKIVHIEAGARSFDISMPEERNRIETDRMSDYLFAHSQLCAENLRREKARGKIFNTGNPGVDAAVKYAKQGASAAPSMGLEKRGYVLLTLHRQDTTDTPGVLESFLTSLGKLRHEFIFPVHPRARRRLGAFRMPENIHATGPMGYLDFLGTLKDSAAIVSDSGGVQLEAVTLGIPCFVARRSTEYWEALNAGSIRLVGLDAELLAFNLRLLRAAPFPRMAVNPYGKPGTSREMAKLLAKLLG